MGEDGDDQGETPPLCSSHLVSMLPLSASEETPDRDAFVISEVGDRLEEGVKEDARPDLREIEETLPEASMRNPAASASSVGSPPSVEAYSLDTRARVVSIADISTYLIRGEKGEGGGVLICYLS